MRVRSLWTLSALLPWLITACGGTAPSPNCPMYTAGCPSPMPSYSGQVAAIIQARCESCHSATGVEPNRPYTNYAEIKKFQIDMLVQVRNCMMPPAGSPELTIDERAQLLGWFYCDGPNN